MKTASITRTALAVLIVLGLSGSTFAGKTIYVDDNAVGSNDGSSWADAYNYLQDALADANSNSDVNEIRVAQGTYKPDQGVGITPGDREATFQLISGVTIKGGFAGLGKPDPNARDISLYETILSGDLLGDDAEVADTYGLLTEPTRDENSYHVVVAADVDTMAVLDGLTITGGNADNDSGQWPDRQNMGGGIYVRLPNGGTLSPNVNVLNCAFRRNTALANGGGISITAGDSTLTNCTFVENATLGEGGGVYNDESLLALTDCTFSGNLSSEAGGGFFNDYKAEARLVHCTFIGNIGRGMHNGDSQTTLTNCTFIANEGGGMSNSKGQMTAINCVFSGNTAKYHGGGISSSSYKDVILTNCAIVGNTASSDGGGIRLSRNDHPVLANCVLWGNRDRNGTGESAQVYVDGGALVVNYSCIQGLSGNLGGTGNIGDDPRFVDANGVDNIPGNADDNYRLLAGSPCLDTGSNAALPPSVTLDLDGKPRITDGVVDVGPYEGPKQGFLLSTQAVSVPEGATATFTVALAADPLGPVQVAVVRQSGDTDVTVQSGGLLSFDSSDYSVPQMVTLAAAEDADNLDGTVVIMLGGADFPSVGISATEVENEPVTAVLYVDDSAPGINDGSSWAGAYTDLQDALGVAAAHPVVDEIRVAGGSYTPAEPFSGDRTATFRPTDGLTLTGGYAGFGAANPDARDFDAYRTVLSGDLAGDDGAYFAGNGENSCHVVTIDEPDVIVDGLTIVGGNANRGTDKYARPDVYGGGLIATRTPKVTNVTFVGNFAMYGGGMCPELEAVLINCTFRGNRAGEDGGAFWLGDGNATLINCTICGNSARQAGGGVMLHIDNHTELVNCVISGNSAGTIGGGIFASDCFSDRTLVNCIVIGNSAGEQGGGMFSDSGYEARPTNCIFWANTDADGSGESAQISPGQPPVYYSCIQGWSGDFGGIGNFGDDPLLADADGPDDVYGTEDDDLRLLAGSPCLDAGDNDFLPRDWFDLDGDGDTNERLPLDFVGNPRRVDDPHAPDVGNPGSVGAPVVDVGIYEGAGQGLLLSGRSVVVPEQSTATFTVTLAEDPLQAVTVTMTWTGGDSDLTVAGGSTLQFDSSNYDQPQTVTLAAADDVDNLNGTAVFELTAPGIGRGVVHATEADNDSASRVLYVDDDAAGINTGLSWTEAYTELRDALEISARYPGVVKEIRVAQGIYTPACPARTRAATFQLQNGVAVRGGFAGLAGADPDARDVRQYETILSGDVLGNDVDPEDPYHIQYEPSWFDNSYHVVTASGTDATAVLDGVTITAGYASGHDPDDREDGGGVYNHSGSPTLTHCTFRGNDCRDDGSAMYNLWGSPTLADCKFEGNFSSNAALCNDNSSPTLMRCEFVGNYGGGIVNRSGCNPEMTRCVFRENLRSGMFNGDSSPTLTFCDFIGNRAFAGAGVYNTSGGTPTFVGCTFLGNTCRGSLGGGAFRNMDGDPTLINCIFSGNTAVKVSYEVYGGAILSWEGNATLINCTFSNNYCEELSGGIYDRLGNATLVNCVLWGNSDAGGSDQSAQIDGLQPSTVDYSCIQGWTGSLGGIGNIGIDPCFVEPGYWDPNGTPADANDDFWVEGDYHLLIGSQCIDTGDPSFMAEPNETDLDGNPRVIGGRVDMGAYEFWGPVYVDDDAPNDPGPGDPQVSDPLEDGTEAHPFDTIQKAIDLSVDWYTVLVRQGSYFEPAGGSTVDFLGKNITLKSEDPTDWDIIDNTVIRSYVQFSGTEDPSCKFAGFKIRNLEGAIYGNHTHATISHCNISGNGPCGATVIQDCDGTISNCLITDNTTFFFCGVYPVVFECNGLIKNCTIANNESGLSVGSATIENCIIYNNTGPQLTVTNGNTVNISYSNVQDGLKGVVSDGQVNWGPGNIDTDPCFVRLGYWITDEITLIEGDYHLRSEGWRWNTEDRSWTYNYTTSRCVDAGNPGSPLLGELMSVPRDPDNVWGINLRINMGAFGGTSQASLPPYDWALLADLNNDGTVNFFDFAYQTQDWLATAPEQRGDLNRDGVVNKIDLAALAKSWLQITLWCEL